MSPHSLYKSSYSKRPLQIQSQGGPYPRADVPTGDGKGTQNRPRGGKPQVTGQRLERRIYWLRRTQVLAPQMWGQGAGAIYLQASRGWAALLLLDFRCLASRTVGGKCCHLSCYGPVAITGNLVGTEELGCGLLRPESDWTPPWWTLLASQLGAKPILQGVCPITAPRGNYFHLSLRDREIRAQLQDLNQASVAWGFEWVGESCDISTSPCGCVAGQNLLAACEVAPAPELSH